MQLTFYGGAGMVTGSNFLLEDDSGERPLKVMVDCGLMQGNWLSEVKNWDRFPYDAATVDYLLVTHAHIDHIGRIPKLVRDGFRGHIISTEATRALALPMLMDSMELLQDAGERHGKKPLYGEKDILMALSLWRGVFYHEPVALPSGFSVQFSPAGHILGAGMVELSRNGKKIIFTGDLGGHSDLLDPAESIEGAHYVVMESVYGDRRHDERKTRLGELKRIITETAQRGGTLLIPAFSTERTQELLFDLRTLMQHKEIPSMPVFLDSPLAIKVTKIFLEHPTYLKPAIRERIEAGEDPFTFPELKITEKAHDSHHIDRADNPKIILAGSGMSMGGRVLAHERKLLGREDATLCMVGYQSAGSLGRRLLEGAKTVGVLGEPVTVRARIEHIFSYSGHMDSKELLEFAAAGSSTLQKIFLVMGEPASSMHLAQRIRDYAGIDARVPKVGERVEIDI